MTCRLAVIDPRRDKRWDDFVRTHPLGTIYHHSAWGEILETTYGYERLYVALEEASTRELSGVLPFMFVKSRLTGHRLVSQPFAAYCDPLVPEGNVERLAEFALQHYPSSDYLELRLLREDTRAPANVTAQVSHTTHLLTLTGDPEALWKSFHDTSVRQRVRRAERNKLELRVAESERGLKAFYSLEIAVRKKHGLPPAPYAFFANIWRILTPLNLLEVPLVEYEGKVIAAAIILKFNKTVHFEYSASDGRFLKLCPNQKLIWEVVKRASAEGYGFFDFGRSAFNHKSLIDFKERWGAERRPLSYWYFAGAKTERTGGSRGRRALEAVNRHLPKAILRAEGKILYRHLG